MKNREIKFRAYWKGVNQMVHFDGENGEFTWNPQKKIGMFIPAECGELFLGEPYIMQSIGLKNKFGKDIYEGDIIRICTGKVFTAYGRIFSEVKYFEDHACFGFTTPNGWLTFTPGNFSEIEEIVGNIYQNSELLKYTK